jgi:hypothetical protein
MSLHRGQDLGLHTRLVGRSVAYGAGVGSSSICEVLICVQRGQLLLTAHSPPPSLMAGTPGGLNARCGSEADLVTNQDRCLLCHQERTWRRLKAHVCLCQFLTHALQQQPHAAHQVLGFV